MVFRARGVVMDQASTPALDRILRGEAPAFALLHRPETVDPGQVEVLVGAVSELSSLDELPLPDVAAEPRGGPGADLVALLPYRQIAERGFVAVDDGTPLLAMAVEEQETVAVEQVIDRLPDRCWT